MYDWYALIGWFNYYFPVVFFAVLIYFIVIVISKTRTMQALCNESLANQRVMIGILKEIRDSLNI